MLTSVNGKQVTSLHYQVIDLEFLASREKSAKRRRLMLTPDFGSWQTTITINPNNKATVKPFFYEGLKQYNSMGTERIDRRSRAEGGKGGATSGQGGKEKEDERSFFGKYWMYIAIGIFIFTKFIDTPEP